MAKAVIDVKDLWLRYRESNWVLKGVSLKVLEGETVLIVGPSGGGKTSLARALTGLATKVFGAEVKGEIEVCSRPIHTLNHTELQKCIQFVNQDPYVHFLEPIAADDLISYAEKMYGNRAWEVVKSLAKMTNIEDLIVKPLTSLSGGQIRKLAIVKALIADPSIVILDEPLMWLDDVEGVELVYSVLSMLKRLNKTTIVMEHRFLHILDRVDKVYVLKDGRIFLAEELKGFAAGSRGSMDVSMRFPESNICTPVLELNNIWFRYGDGAQWILKGVDLRVCQGDTVVIYGRNGSGKSTLLKVITGLLKPIKGSRKAYRRMLYIPQTPYLFITEDSILNEVRELCRGRKPEVDCVDRGIEMLKNFGYRDLETLPINLSWGQQTRLAVLLASAVAEDSILLLDEPFTGSTYIDSLNLVNTLLSLSRSTKIITLSSKDYIPLFRNAKTYVLYDGVLKPLTYNNNHVLEGIRLAYKLFS